MDVMIFTVAGVDLMTRLLRCGAYCDERGYQVASAIVGDGTVAQWDQLLLLLRCRCPGHDRMAHPQAGEASLIVVHDRSDLPPGRLPRWEAVTDAPPPPRGVRRLRRLVPNW